MNEPGEGLILARVRVYDDLARETFTVDLEDVVRLMENAARLGGSRKAIIALMNAHLLERHPQLRHRSTEELSIGIADYSDLKVDVAERLAACRKPTVAIESTSAR